MDVTLELLAKQFQKFKELNTKLCDMLTSEEVQKNWEENYHLIDHDWLVNWKDIISFDELDKQNSEGDINDIIERKINKIQNSNNKEFCCLKEKDVVIDPMKPFDIISDEVWKLFVLKNKSNNNSGKVSLLKGKGKILIRLDENNYYIKYLTNLEGNLFGEFIIVFVSGENKEKLEIIEDIAESNIYIWMKKIGFKTNEKQFTVTKYKIPFDIKQKTNNYVSPNVSFDTNRALDVSKYGLSSSISYSFACSCFSNSSSFSFTDSSEFRNFFSHIQNFRIIQKCDETSNILSIMRCLSLIGPFAEYFMSNFNGIKIFSKFGSSSLINLIREFFLNLYSDEKSEYPSDKFIVKILKNFGIEIKKEQDPFDFVDKIMKYINQKLIPFKDFDDFFNIISDKIKGKLYKDLNEDEDIEKDLKKIIHENRSIIGKCFLGIILEKYRCDKCEKDIKKLKAFNIMDIDYKGIIDELDSKYNSFVGIDMDFFLEPYFLQKKIEKMEKPIIVCTKCGRELKIKEKGREIIYYPEYLIIRLNKGTFDENKGFEDQISSLYKDYIKIEDLEKYSSDKIINENISSMKYVLIHMINSYEDQKKKNIRFLSICKSPFVDKMDIWIRFRCNKPPIRITDPLRDEPYKNNKNKHLNNQYITEKEKEEENQNKNHQSNPYILFYKLEKK